MFKTKATPKGAESQSQATAADKPAQPKEVKKAPTHVTLHYEMFVSVSINGKTYEGEDVTVPVKEVEMVKDHIWDHYGLMPE